jgi:uncharacterized protein YoxC
MKRYTVKELREMIKAKDKYINYLVEWVRVLAKDINRKQATINNQKKRIKVLGKALVASQRDYEELKRSRRKK